MTPSPSIPERCSPLDLASPVMLRQLTVLEQTKLREFVNAYPDGSDFAIARRVLCDVINGAKNIITLAALESQLP